jgi:hypothetical protein
MKQIAFIDCAVADIETLWAGLRPDIEAVMLSSLQAAPRQIAIALQGRCDFEAIHIIAHGQPGEVRLGAGALSLETIEEHRSQLAEIGRALAADGKTWLWVCDAARGRRGAAFLDGLRLATGAAVLGATGLVGAAARGARWELDASVGGTAQPPLTGEGIANYAGVMTNFTATTGGEVTLSIGDTTINNGEKGAVAITSSGIDGDVTSATVTFSDGTTTVKVDASAGTADLSTLADGPVSSVLNVTDGAGNTASANGATITLDTTADGGGDLAVSITDTSINNAEKGVVAFATSGIDADVASATVTFSDGTHSVTVNASAGVADLSGLNDGPVSSVLNVTDGAGNTASANGAMIALDPTASSAPTTLDLAAADDTGSSSTDNITHNTSALTISGVAETGAVSLFDDVDNSGTLDGAESVITTTTAAGSAFSADITLTEGTHHILAFQTDAAGNVSVNSTSIDITVDTTAPSNNFSGDGNADILWQNASGLPAIWSMDGTNITGGAALPNPGPTWNVA